MSNDERSERLERLAGYLEQDPGNINLALEYAEAALDANQPQRAREALDGLARAGQLDDAATNLAGIAAMRAGDQAAAQARFEQLLRATPEDSALRFNLAWSRALAADWQGAREVLDETTVRTLPQAAMLDLQLHHQLGEFDQARDKLTAYLERHGAYAPLQAAASVLAMDIDDPDLALACATRGGDHPDALATLGALALGESRHFEAETQFERSLAMRSANPRAHIGLGLVRLVRQDADGARALLDEGAREFGDHLGSWIGAGWAHYLAGDPGAARARFETALALDDTFAEVHGSLAALDALAGDTESARQRLERAIRLDRNSFSAALAGILLAQAEDDPDKARRLFDRAVSQPLTHDGKTLAEALAAMSL